MHRRYESCHFYAYKKRFCLLCVPAQSTDVRKLVTTMMNAVTGMLSVMFVGFSRQDYNTEMTST